MEQVQRSVVSPRTWGAASNVPIYIEDLKEQGLLEFTDNGYQTDVTRATEISVVAVPKLGRVRVHRRICQTPGIVCRKREKVFLTHGLRELDD